MSKASRRAKQKARPKTTPEWLWLRLINAYIAGGLPVLISSYNAMFEPKVEDTIGIVELADRIVARGVEAAIGMDAEQGQRFVEACRLIDERLKADYDLTHRKQYVDSFQRWQREHPVVQPTIETDAKALTG